MWSRDTRPIFLDIPNLVTKEWAILYAFYKSSYAPDVILPKNSFSAHLPANIDTIWCLNSISVYKESSFGKYCAKPSAPLLLGMIVNFNNGYAPSKYHEITPCPHSWTATISLYFGSPLNSFSKPPIIHSTAISKSCSVTKEWFSHTA